MTAGARDPFEVLGIPPTSDESLIKTAYRAAAKHCHPDVDRGDDAAARFRELSEAFEALKDPGARDAAVRRHSASPGAQPHDAFGKVFEFLDNHGRGTERRPLRTKKRGIDREVVLTVSLEQAFAGGDVVVPGVNGQCTVCSGSGTVPTRLRPECPDCGGFGYTRLVKGFTSVQSPCKTCRGVGAVDFADCGACGGLGVSERESTIIDIPPGCQEGYVVTVPECGNGGRSGGSPGDLIVSIAVADHDRFKRVGENLETEITLPVWSLGLGCKAEIVGIDGRRMTVGVPQGAHPGMRLSLRGQGMPAYPGRGNLVVVLKAFLPPGETPELRKAYAALEAAWSSSTSAASKADTPTSPTS